MTTRPSRYDTTPPFSPPLSETFGGIQARRVSVPPGVVEHVVQRGESFQSIAFHYYGDTRLWYWILDANPQLMSASSLSQRAKDDDPLIIVIPAAPR